MSTVTRSALIQELAAAFEISTPEAASRVTFNAEELEMPAAGPFTDNQAAEIERCIAADLRASK